MEQGTGSKLGKQYIKAVYCLPAYLTYMNLYAEYIMQNARLDESQAGRNQDCWEKQKQPQIYR